MRVFTRNTAIVLGVAGLLGAAASSRVLQPVPRADAIVVHKAKRTLEVFAKGKRVRAYRIALGSRPEGHKQKQGDRRTPEGRYTLTHKNPNSKFTLSLGISYPNSRDAAAALAEKRISRAEHDAILRAERRGALPPQDTALGGEIFIHGSGSGRDWTWGCVALDDPDMRELYRMTRPGIPVTIHP